MAKTKQQKSQKGAGSLFYRSSLCFQDSTLLLELTQPMRPLTPPRAEPSGHARVLPLDLGTDIQLKDF